MAKAVRMADIAQRLGISTVSVSKGLAGKEGVSAEMRAKILATAEEMGYQPPARTNAHPGGESIGILVADRFFNENAFYSNLYRAVLKAATEQDISVLMEIVLPQAEKSCNMPTFLVNRKVDGLIFMGEISRRYLATAVQTGVPFMLLDFYDDAIAADCVLSDNTSGSYTVTEHLISTGRRNIGFVGSVLSTSSIMDRYLGYVKAMLRAGLPIRDDWRLEDRDDQGKFMPFSLPHEMPDAFVCNCDAVAYNLVETLKRNGYRVPQDVAVTGYDDYRYSTLCSPQLTSYRVDLDGMAKTVVAQLRRKIQNSAATRSGCSAYFSSLLLYCTEKCRCAQDTNLTKNLAFLQTYRRKLGCKGRCCPECCTAKSAQRQARRCGRGETRFFAQHGKFCKRGWYFCGF